MLAAFGLRSAVRIDVVRERNRVPVNALLPILSLGSGGRGVHGVVT